MPGSERLLAGIASALLLASFVLHAWNLPGIPADFYQDEEAIGIDAFMISRTGHDSHGEFFPLYFQSLDDWKAPIYIYATAALFTIFEPGYGILRIVSYFFFAIFLVGYLTIANDVTKKSPSGSVFAILAGSFVPWIFTISRVAFEIISQVAIVSGVLALLYFRGKRETNRVLRDIVLGALLGLAMYAYPTSRLLVPMLFGVIVISVARMEGIKKTGHIAAGFFMAIVPYAAYLLRHSDRLLSRFGAITYVHDGSLTQWEKITIFAGNYISHFSPTFLFLQGDENRRHATGFGGEIFIVIGILCIVGLAAAFAAMRKRESKTFWITVVALLFLSPVASALTNDGVPHALRSATMCIAILVLAAAGFASVEGKLSRKAPWAIVALNALLLLESMLFVTHYFTDYRDVSASAFRGDESVDLQKFIDEYSATTRR